MNFSISVSTSERKLFNIDDFNVEENKITFLFGESGIGKSLLSKAIYGLLDQEELTISINGKSYRDYLSSDYARELKQHSFFVFQEPSSHLNPLMRLGDQLNEGSISATSSEKEILSHLWNQISETDIQNLLTIFPKAYRPSGGEKQRILLAMAFKKLQLWVDGKTETPTFFVFDEPTGSLDNRFRNLFLSLLIEKFSKRKFTANLITHDYSIISEMLHNYSHLKNFIEFKELTSEDGTLKLNTFNPELYMNWIESESSKTTSENFNSEPEKTEILKLESDLTVFNRNMSLFSDSGYKTKSPLIIRKGELVYLKAPSGIGKTTVAKVIIGLYRSSKYSMKVHDQVFTEKTPQSVWRKDFWGTKIGMVFQHADESLNMNSTVIDSFKGLPVKTKLTDQSLLEFLNPFFGNKITPDFLKTKIKFLSGGQKQRINLLRSMISNPELIILDEPLNGLDFKTMLLVIDLIRKMQENGTGILLISHNEEIFDSIIPEKNIYYLSVEE